MILKFIKEKRKIFISLLFSYLTIILVSLIISAVAYIQSVRVIQTEINKANHAMLKQLQDTIDNKLNDIDKIINTIVLDKNVIAQCNLVEPIQPAYRLSMLQVISTIGTSKVTNSYIKDVFIYVPKRDLIVSDKGTSSGMEYFNSYYPNEVHDEEAWIKFLKQLHKRDFYPMSSRNTEYPNLGGVVLLQSIPSYGVEESNATLGIILDRAFLENSLSNLNKGLGGNSIIINSRNEVVASLNNQSDLNVPDLNLIGNQGSLKLKLGSSKVDLTFIKSANVDWSYINIVPRSFFSKQAKDVITVMLVCTFLCLIGGTFVALLFARKNYNPIDNIMMMFSRIGKIKYDHSLNEFKLIEKSMLSIIDENQSITSTWEQHKETLKDNFLNRLVKGYIKSSLPLDDRYSTYGIDLNGDHFVVIGFYLEDVGKIHFSENDESDDKSIELAQFIVRNIMEELVGKHFNCVFFEVDKSIVCIANIDKSSEDTDFIQNEIISGKNLIFDKYGILLTASISNVHSTISGIPEAYKECLEAAEYKIVVGDNNIILYSDIYPPDRINFTNTYPIEVQQQFINSIRAGDFAHAKQVMQHVFDQNFANPNISLDMARCLMFAIVNTMINAFNDRGLIYDSKFIESLNPFRKLIECKTIFKMQKQMTDILLKIEQAYNEKNKVVNSSKSMEIIAYIERQYSDSSLSVASIASEFGLTPVYMSRFFKSQTGEGVLSTINKTRLEKAKAYLLDDELSIKNIAELTGFLNSNMFIRTFKKNEGVTPGKYRELNNVLDRS
ncbi:helix-turn-helix domain-containing protein [Paenibacillus sp. MWE-103]|uniref:Helix-turn-helix domain-containing protein n=1 Tax=Paenibacillus artemisiicola TaxID=1172618 RepID=A0ABS3WEI6_9BACL|nr:helix-turn-helix domain-containing protein [Paenibacillus artemisiicola]MBO7746724.1 helix-turn-helix domain-containing protein [Paenibacillus artemisiicola]